ncbi:MAG: hypothetical protein ACOYOA_10695 [Saprospiraceae bacterium]
MKRTQLWKLICALDKKDLRELRKFVCSPFFNQREDVIALFDTLMKYLKDHNAEASKETAFAIVYPGEKYDAGKLHLISSILNGLCEEYLIWKERSSDVVNDQLILSQAYRKLKLEKPFLSTIKEAQLLHEKQPLRNAEYHAKKYEILLEEFEYLIQNKRLEEFNLQEILNHLDKSFVSRLLRLECAILSHQAVAKKTYESGVFDINHISEKLQAPAVTIYNYGYHALRDNDEAAFEAFMGHLKDEVLFFPLSEQKDIFLMAINFCIRKFNAGNEKYASILFEVYKEGLEKKVLIENNNISQFTFSNIVRTAAYIKEWDWAEDFVHQFAGLLEKQYQESLFNFSLGRINYERKNYDNALTYLSKAEEKNDVLISLNSKALRTKVYFELTEINLLISHLSAFKIYLNRHKEIGYHKNLYDNFIKFTNRLVNININKSTYLEKLKQEIEGEKELMERKWLLEQIEHLK